MPTLTTVFRVRMVWAMIAGGLQLVVETCNLLAQAPSSPPGNGGSTTVIVSGRNFTVEWILTVLMCGAALFVVCRSSRRN